MVTDKDLEMLEKLIYWAAPDYPNEAPAWFKACERWKSHRDRKAEFDKFVAWLRPRAEQCERRHHVGR
jgi:hypothetical protein